MRLHTLSANDRALCFQAWAKGYIDTEEFENGFFRTESPEGVNVTKEEFPNVLHEFYEEYGYKGYICPFAK